jgi:hypothetical protein
MRPMAEVAQSALRLPNVSNTTLSCQASFNKVQPVPELTSNHSIKLNPRLWLRDFAGSLRFLPSPYRAAARRTQMTYQMNTTNLAWQNTWHLWRVVIPRRSITGWLVWGQVWRRREQDQWMYKKVVEYIDGEPACSAAPPITL